MDAPRRFSQKEVRNAIRTRMVLDIDPRLIRPKPDQPRQYFDPEALERLTKGLGHSGQADPVIVRPVDDDDPKHQFQLVAGERRWRAASAVKMPLSAIVRVYKTKDDEDDESILENFNREPLTHMETCRALHKMMASQRIQGLGKGVRLEVVAERFGRSVEWVSQHMNLKRLRPEYQALVDPPTSKKDRLPLALAVRLSGLPYEHQDAVYGQYRNRGLSTKRAQRLIDKTIHDHGLSEHRRGRKPQHELESLEKVTRRFRDDLAVILDKPRTEFDSLVSKRPVPWREQLLADLEELLDDAATLRDMVRRNCPIRAAS